MEKEKYWLQFIISGKAEDYIKYSNARNVETESRVDYYSFYNRRISDRAEQYRG